MTSVRITSKAALKTAGTSLLVSGTSVWFVNVVLTVPVGWMLRPLIAAGIVLAVGITIGCALRMQGGDTE